MGTLNRDEIERRLQKNELLKPARRRADGTFDLEPASYDMMAGWVVWKEPRRNAKKGEVQSLNYQHGKPFEEQPTVTLQPGQMMFVITYEELQMPTTVCGTVLSRNRLAREGILALNAGHVDPGFHGPIVIRLINLRSTPWTLTLGEPIFTVVFHTVDVHPHDKLVAHPAISLEKTLKGVRESADEALSNALFDLYAMEMQESLLTHYSSVEERLRTALSEDFVSKKILYTCMGTLVAIVTIIESWHAVEQWVSSLFK